MRPSLLVLLVAAVLPAETLRVMTFNVRYPSPDDGENRWECRRDLLVKTIRDTDPDLLGTQELFYEQGQYIAEKAPAYSWFGISRRGNHEDEHMGVFYKKEKLRVVNSGDFWLSEKPETPGSMSWDVSLPRMVTWALFEIKATGHRFYYYNTHFPHRRQDDQARLKSAQVIVERMRTLPSNVPFIMTGDFNAPAGNNVYQLFAADLKNAWGTAAKQTGPEGTMSGFRGSTEGRRIDWIFYRGPIKVVEAETIVRSDNGHYPSDHFPVTTLLEFAAEPKP
jgi:endonuclease/exonuclease/phosphatase family metal-dependent hydrolase